MAKLSLKLILLVCSVLLLKVSYSMATTLNTPSLLSDKNRVSLLIASQTGAGQSSFGHAYLRFSKDIFKDDDIVVELVADQAQDQNSVLMTIIKGVGLLSQKFRSKLVFSSYESVRYEMNIIQDRNLKSLPLNLSTDQISNIKLFLDSKKEFLESENYLFFTNNCASKISKVIDESIDLKVNTIYSQIPIFLEKKYALLIDTNLIYLDKSASNLRKELIEKYLPIEIKSSRYPYFKNIEQQLTNVNYIERAYGVLKLLKAKQFFTKLSEESFLNIKTFILLFSQTETIRNRIEIIDLALKGSENIIFQPLQKQILDFPITLSGLTEYQTNNRMEVRLNDANEPIVRFFFTIMNNDESKTISEKFMDISIKSFGFSFSSGKLLYKIEDRQEVVGYLLKSKIFNTDNLLTKVHFHAEIYSGEKWFYLIPVAILEFAPDISPGVLGTNFFKPEDAMPIKNFSNNGLGNCMSIALMNKILFEQIKFLPDQEYLSSEKNLNLLKEALEGKFVIIPGYQNVRSLILSLDQEKLKQVISSYSYKLNISGFGSLVKAYFTREKIKPENLSDLYVSLALKIPIAMRFKVDNINVEHMILVTEIVDQGEYLELGVFDSNIAGYLPANLPDLQFVNRYTIDKKTGLFKQGSYSKGTSIYVDRSDLSSQQIYIRAKHSAKMMNFFNHSSKLGKYSFSINEIYQNL